MGKTIGEAGWRRQDGTDHSCRTATPARPGGTATARCRSRPCRKEAKIASAPIHKGRRCQGSGVASVLEED